MPSVFDYSDFRKFLSDYYQSKKAQAAGYTYKKFADAAGLNSANYLKLVMDGDRKLTNENIHLFAKALNLNFQEHRYFENLVNYDQADQAQDRSYYKAVLSELILHRPNVSKRVNSDSVLAEWYVPAILVCLDGLPIKGAEKAIVKKTAIPLDTVKPFLELLKKNDFVTIDDGMYRLSSSYLDYRDSQSKNANHKRFQQQQILLSQRVLQKRYDQGARFISHTFTIANDSLPAYIEMLRSFIQQMAKVSNAEPAEKVAQLNIQLFTLCK